MFSGRVDGWPDGRFPVNPDAATRNAASIRTILVNLPVIIVADRGRLKAYAVEKNENRSIGVPRLWESMEIEEALGRYRDNFTDQAGAFPDGASPGQANSTAERMNLAAEQEMRSFRMVASRMIELLRDKAPERWGFAAPPEINGAILDGLPVDLRERLARNVPRDLVNVPAPELLRHFQ